MPGLRKCAAEGEPITDPFDGHQDEPCGARVRAALAKHGPMDARTLAAVLALPVKRVEAVLATLARDGEANASTETGVWTLKTGKERR